MPQTVALEAAGRDLQRLDEALIRCVRQRDPERLVAAVFAPDAMLLAPGRPLASGAEAILAFWRYAFSRGLIDVRVETQFFAAEHDLAYGVGLYSTTVETHPGMLQTLKGKYLLAYRRQADGGWRVAVASYSGGA